MIIKTNEIIKYISPRSESEVSKDLSSNKFINPKIIVKNKILNIII